MPPDRTNTYVGLLLVFKWFKGVSICYAYFSTNQDLMMLKEKGKTKKSKQDGKEKKEKQEANEGWMVFCDFYEIMHTVIKETMVTIIRQDNKKMVRENHKDITWHPVSWQSERLLIVPTLFKMKHSIYLVNFEPQQQSILWILSHLILSTTRFLHFLFPQVNVLVNVTFGCISCV